jgi:hypothetical protein
VQQVAQSLLLHEWIGALVACSARDVLYIAQCTRHLTHHLAQQRMRHLCFYDVQFGALFGHIALPLYIVFSSNMAALICFLTSPDLSLLNNIEICFTCSESDSPGPRAA